LNWSDQNRTKTKKLFYEKINLHPWYNLTTTTISKKYALSETENLYQRFQILFLTKKSKEKFDLATSSPISPEKKSLQHPNESFKMSKIRSCAHFQALLKKFEKPKNYLAEMSLECFTTNNICHNSVQQNWNYYEKEKKNTSFADSLLHLKRWVWYVHTFQNLRFCI
jgi:hypothetical protein